MNTTRVVPTDGTLVEVARAAMGTVVSIQIAGETDLDAARSAAWDALHWIDRVEASCSRFRPDSEVWGVARSSPGWTTASPLLLDLLELALVLSERSAGAFDPTLGAQLSRRGFSRAWDSGRNVEVPARFDFASSGSLPPPWERIAIDRTNGRIGTKTPTLLDFGGLAKGFAVDLVHEALVCGAMPYANVCINAGGDLRVHGGNARGEPWRIGIADPRTPGALLTRVTLYDEAVCTSGTSAQRDRKGASHLVDSRVETDRDRPLSVSVLAPTAAVADGLATAAFVLGPDRAQELLEAERTSGLFLLANGQCRIVGDAALAYRWALA